MTTFLDRMEQGGDEFIKVDKQDDLEANTPQELIINPGPFIAGTPQPPAPPNATNNELMYRALLLLYVDGFTRGKKKWMLCPNIDLLANLLKIMTGAVKVSFLKSTDVFCCGLIVKDCFVLVKILLTMPNGDVKDFYEDFRSQYEYLKSLGIDFEMAIQPKIMPKV
ncbi:MAG: hypothetical protein LBR24_04355 [Methanobrevibacter sp.]|nr:hypothetical protein [Methanobrevibacter sp.]